MDSLHRWLLGSNLSMITFSLHYFTRFVKKAGILFFISNLFLVCSPLLAYERVYTTAEDALRNDFPTHTRVNQETITITGNIQHIIEKDLSVAIRNNTAELYTLYEDVTLLGYAVTLDEQGKYEPITVLTSISPEFSVSNVTVLVYREKIGDSVRKKRFTKQFKQKTLSDPLLINRDLDGISGATVSSWSMATAVRKSLLIVKGLSSENSL